MTQSSVTSGVTPGPPAGEGPRRVVVATANPHKLAEIREIIGPVLGGRVELLPRPGDIADIEETGATLEDNARIKAATVCSATGIAAIADDTGLEVAALDGAPGVFSARYAGEGASYADNVERLLGDLDGVEDRRARFATVAICVFPDGRELVARGEVEGSIARAPRGSGGFGYDPVFVPDESAPRTFAELTADEKHAVSHRGRAFRHLADLLRSGLAASP